MEQKERRDVRNPADEAVIEHPGEPDLPEQDNEVDPDRRTRREAAADKLELNRTGGAAAGALLDADPDLDEVSETEAALRRATEDGGKR